MATSRSAAIAAPPMVGLREDHVGPFSIEVFAFDELSVLRLRTLFRSLL
jgi:hypothetical protein